MAPDWRRSLADTLGPHPISGESHHGLALKVSLKDTAARTCSIPPTAVPKHDAKAAFGSAARDRAGDDVGDAVTRRDGENNRVRLNPGSESRPSQQTGLYRPAPAVRPPHRPSRAARGSGPASSCLPDV